VIVDQVLSKEVIKVSASIGKAEPIHASSVGKCLLAFQKDKTKERMLGNKEMPAYTQNTICTLDDLEAELEKIRSMGYAVDNEEVNIGVRCVAAPIRNYRGETLSCIGVSGPATRIRMPEIEKYANVVKDTALIISSKIGYKGK
jgi:DNA-binding IclR family transcriptional regulator